MARRPALSLALVLAGCAAPAPDRTSVSLQVSGAVERRLGFVSEQSYACYPTMPTAPPPLPGEVRRPHNMVWLLSLGDDDRAGAPRFRLDFEIGRDGAPIPGTGSATLELDGRRWDGWFGAPGGTATLDLRPEADLARGSFTARLPGTGGEVTVAGRWSCPRGFQAWMRNPG